MIGRVRKEGQCAPGSERCLLPQVLDRTPKCPTVAELFFDHIGFVVDSKEHASHAKPHKVQNDPFQDGAPRDANHRLGKIIGHRPKPLSPPTSHDYRPIGPRRASKDVVKRMKPHQPSFVIEDRNLIQPTTLHQLENLSSTGRRTDGDTFSLDVRVQRSVEPSPSKQAAPDVSVSECPDEPPILILDQHDAKGGSLQ